MSGADLDLVSPLSTRLDDFARALDHNRYLFMPGGILSCLLSLSPEEIRRFGDHWNRLTRDGYMGDGGTYRYRRYGELERSPGGQWRRMPHRPYEQPRYINPLNGGVARLFDPLEPGFCEHQVLTRLLDALGMLYDHREGGSCHWNVRLHPYRIFASDDMQGHPTPEGLHRDGVDYIVSMLLCRRNVVGGETTITDEHRQVIWRRTLSQPLDIVVGDDHRTMHAVSPITPLKRGASAYRDVLVVAFTRVDV
jgi:hypothetical protein